MSANEWRILWQRLLTNSFPEGTHLHEQTLNLQESEGVSKVNVGLRLGEPPLTYPQAEP